MAYFPLFVDLEGCRGLIVGGGKTALGKAKRLLDYGLRLTVVAPEVLPELENLPGVAVIPRAFQTDDLNGDDTFVIAATNDRQINHEISVLCKKGRIPVNVVDTPEDCTFLFPCLVRRGPLSIGISTGGASPTGAIYVKNQINGLLPDTMGEILSWLDSQRGPMKQKVGSEETRKVIFQRLFERCLSLNRPLTAEETQSLMEAAEGGRQR